MNKPDNEDSTHNHIMLRFNKPIFKANGLNIITRKTNRKQKKDNKKDSLAKPSLLS